MSAARTATEADAAAIDRSKGGQNRDGNPPDTVGLTWSSQDLRDSRQTAEEPAWD